jgi:large subunit ribosomal protein L3
MPLGVVGQKRGMTRVFTEEGASVPVTVIEVQPNRVTHVRTEERDGYSAIQITTGSRKAKALNKPATGHFVKANVEAGRGLWEFRLERDEGGELKVGSEIRLDLFTQGQKVDVTGVSIGKGFAGTVKRHNFRTQDATHGNSVSHRVPGSIGQCQTPGRVFKGKRMAGQLGNVRRTVQNLEVVRVDSTRNLLLVKGAIPGPDNRDVIVRPAIKARS